MNNLVPEKRMDVNGKLVTRHVLPPSASTKPVNNIPVVTGMSEVMQKYEVAKYVGERLFSSQGLHEFEKNPFGDNLDEYSREEAIDALYDLLPMETLNKLRTTVKEGRINQLIFFSMEHSIYHFCLNRQEGKTDHLPDPTTIQEIADTAAICYFVDTFTDGGAEAKNVAVSVVKASSSIQRVCSGPEWEKRFLGNDLRDRLLESEYIVNYITNEQLEWSEQYELDPDSLIQQRLELLNSVDIIKKNQNLLKERGSIDPTLINELDDSASALREGTL